jgi:hypothetical protein
LKHFQQTLVEIFWQGLVENRLLPQVLRRESGSGSVAEQLNFLDANPG